MKTAIKLIAASVILLILQSCGSGITVTSDFDKTVNFQEYKSFGILPWPEENEAVVNDFGKSRILTSLQQEFEARGLVYKENASSADIAINIFVTTETKTELQSYTSYYNTGYGYYYSPYMGGMGGGTSTTTVSEVEYLVGTVIVDVFDVLDKKLVWQGVGQGVVKESTNNRDERTESAMAKIIAPYPVEKIK